MLFQLMLRGVDRLTAEVKTESVCTLKMTLRIAVAAGNDIGP